MPVGTAYAAQLDSELGDARVRIGWTNHSDVEEAVLKSEHRIMSAYATRGDWDAIRESCESYVVDEGIYEVTGLLPFACGWVLPAAVHDRAWQTRSVPGMKLLRELASELQRRVFVNLTVEIILEGTAAVAEWARRQVPPDADPLELEPEFLSLDEVLSVHAEQLERFGGTDGVRDPNVLASAAIGQPQAVAAFLQGADLYEIAAAYAFHISEGQPFLDGNKRTALNAALLFLVMNNAAMPRDDRGQLYDAMMGIANGRLTRAGLADVFRSLSK